MEAKTVRRVFLDISSVFVNFLATVSVIAYKSEIGSWENKEFLRILQKELVT